jgi:hypothetical protein
MQNWLGGFMRLTLAEDGRLTRRSLLVSTAGLLLAPRLSFGRDDAEDAEVARVKKHAADSGLRDFGVTRNDQYIGIGNADEAFRKECLAMLLGLSSDYFTHFSLKKFDLTKPKERMTVVMLSDRDSFNKYLGGNPGDKVGGIYDPNTNELVLFNNLSEPGNPLGAKDNTLVLTHEATHQLTFSSGLLRRSGDVPKVIAEGLANYTEVRSPNGRDTKIGKTNRRRLDGYRANFRGQLPSIETMIQDDKRIEAPATELEAYSEAWILVHFLMTSEKMRPKFREYLKTIAKRDDASHRLDDWRQHFGDTEAFDKELKAYFRKLK